MYGTIGKKAGFSLYLISHFTLYMSIVALKRNSRRYKAHVSGIGSQGFSLNGGHRNHGAVGPTNLGRSVTRTRFRGAEPMGNGGCCGQYVRNVSNSGSCCTNDPGIIKQSSKNTKGLISSTVTYPTSVYNASCDGGTCPTIWVKDTSPLNYSQGTHTQTVMGTVARCSTENTSGGIPDAGIQNCPLDCGAASYHIGGKKYVITPYTKKVPAAVSAEEHMRTSLLKKNCLPTTDDNQPFPMTLNHGSGGCYVNFLTPAEALAAGQLPTTWVGF